MANGYLLRPLPFTSVTASATAAGFTDDNVGSDLMGLVWKSPTGAATRNIVIDLGADVAVDTISLHGLRDASASWQMSIDLATAAQGAFSGAFWDGSVEEGTVDVLAGSVMPESGLGRGLWEAPAGAPALSRYVRINFSSLGTSAIEVARIVIGERTTIARNFRYGATLGIRPLGSLNWSSRGVPLIRPGRKLRGIGLAYANATLAEVEAQIMPLLENVGNDNPVVIVRDPAADAQRQTRIYYGYLTGNLGSVWNRPDSFNANFNLVAVD